MKIIGLFKRYPLLTTLLGIIWNVSYGLFQLYLSYSQHSWWYLALAAFFLTLGLGRTVVISGKRNERTVMKILAFMMVFLAVIVAGITHLSINELIYPVRNRIVVIAQAAFSFGLISMAIYNLIVSGKRKESRIIMIRNLSLASALGSILSLQRTMLGTFGSPEDVFNLKMQALTGWLVFMILIIMAYELMKTSEKQQ